MMLVPIFPFTYRYYVLSVIFLVVYYRIVRCADGCNNLAWLMQPSCVYLIMVMLPELILFSENRIISYMISSACVRHMVLTCTVTDSFVFRNVQTEPKNVQNCAPPPPIPG